MFSQYKEKPVHNSNKKVNRCGGRGIRTLEGLCQFPMKENPICLRGDISYLDLKSSTFSLDPFKRMCDLSLPGQFDHARLPLQF